MDYDEPHLVPNEKTQPIQRTERPTGALVAGGSLWPAIQVLQPFGRYNFQLLQNSAQGAS